MLLNAYEGRLGANNNSAAEIAEEVELLFANHVANTIQQMEKAPSKLNSSGAPDPNAPIVGDTARETSAKPH